MSITEIHAAPWTTIALWIVKVALAAVFFAAGGAKVYGEPGMVEILRPSGLDNVFPCVASLQPLTANSSQH